jgi:hypothetical protein
MAWLVPSRILSHKRVWEMSDDPNECREYARLCGEQARNAASPEARKHFIELQQSWLRLATQIEYDRAMLELIEGLGEERPPTSRPRSNWSGVGFGRRPFVPTRRREL